MKGSVDRYEVGPAIRWDLVGIKDKTLKTRPSLIEL
jgi:hypothetical protein